jgi:hypothetical protein
MRIQAPEKKFEQTRVSRPDLQRNRGFDRRFPFRGGRFTSDHGEMGGAHGLHGKGPFAYEETIHLPFYVVHPDVMGGQETSAPVRRPALAE